MALFSEKYLIVLFVPIILSYLGLGLQAVRKSVLSVNQTNPDSNVLESVCVNPVVSREWAYGGVTYTIK